MYKIVNKRQLGSQIYLMDIEAPRVAKSANPGQFVIVKMDEKGERIPLTICDYDREGYSNNRIPNTWRVNKKDGYSMKKENFSLILLAHLVCHLNL